MNILILGGTRFLGPALVQACVARGHSVTIFHRGRTTSSQRPPSLPEGIEQQVGDRDKDLSPVLGRAWDAVIDTCGYLPEQLRKSVRLLEGGTGRYVFISSISVYVEGAGVTPEESALQVLPEGPEPTAVTFENYGALKAGCEQVVLDALGERGLLLRPGVIAGSADPTCRFTFWPARLQEPRALHVPEEWDSPIQWVDVRDVAEAAVVGIERGLSGAYNLVASPLPFREFLRTCLQEVNPTGNVQPLPMRAFELAKINPWEHLPLFFPSGSPYADMARTPNQKAVDAGMTFRSLTETIQEVMEAWNRLGDAERLSRLRGFMTVQMEAELEQVSQKALE